MLFKIMDCHNICLHFGSPRGNFVIKIINTILILIALAYGAFLGYCLGRAQGYYKGAEMAQSIYRK
jgi:hypothetical protein